MKRSGDGVKRSGEDERNGWKERSDDEEEDTNIEEQRDTECKIGTEFEPC